MSELRIKTGYSIIWSHDLKRYFVEQGGRDWNLHEAEDFPSQNTMIEIEIPDIEYSDIPNELEEWQPDFNMQRWIAGGEFYDEPYFEGSPPRCAYVLQWLYEQDLIPAGDYIVEVSW